MTYNSRLAQELAKWAEMGWRSQTSNATLTAPLNPGVYDSYASIGSAISDANGYAAREPPRFSRRIVCSIWSLTAPGDFAFTIHPKCAALFNLPVHNSRQYLDVKRGTTGTTGQTKKCPVIAQP